MDDGYRNMHNSLSFRLAASLALAWGARSLTTQHTNREVVPFEGTIDGQDPSRVAKRFPDRPTRRIHQIGRVALVGDLHLAGEMQRPENRNPNSVAPKLSRSVGAHHTFTINLGSGVEMEFISIPAGEFLMGSPESEELRRADENPQHKVTISEAFLMGRFEVTNAQFRRFKADHDSGTYDGQSFNGDDQPVVNVSWNDATGFCEWLSSRSGKFIRLPTEAEWEYACRAGTSTPFHFGTTISTEQAAYNGTYTYGSGRKGESRKQTTKTGCFLSNAFGLHDMYGNVWEWCADWYGDYKWSEGTDPTGPEGGSNRALRGGSWFDIPRNCRSAARNRFEPHGRDEIVGFRVLSEKRLWNP